MPHSSPRDPVSMSVPPRSGQSCHQMKSQSPFTQPAPLSAPGCPLLPRPHAVPCTHQASVGAGASFWVTRLPDALRLLFPSLTPCPACTFSGSPPSISCCCSLPPAHGSSRIRPTCWTWSIWAARIKRRPVTGNLEQQTFITHHSGGWKVQDQGASRLVSGENPLPGFHTATFSLCPHVAQRKRPSLLRLFLQGH